MHALIYYSIHLYFSHNIHNYISICFVSLHFSHTALFILASHYTYFSSNITHAHINYIQLFIFFSQHAQQLPFTLSSHFTFFSHSSVLSCISLYCNSLLTYYKYHFILISHNFSSQSIFIKFSQNIHIYILISSVYSLFSHTLSFYLALHFNFNLHNNTLYFNHSSLIFKVHISKIFENMHKYVTHLFANSNII